MALLIQRFCKSLFYAPLDRSFFISICVKARPQITLFDNSNGNRIADKRYQILYSISINIFITTFIFNGEILDSRYQRGRKINCFVFIVDTYRGADILGTIERLQLRPGSLAHTNSISCTDHTSNLNNQCVRENPTVTNTTAITTTSTRTTRVRSTNLEIDWKKMKTNGYSFGYFACREGDKYYVYKKLNESKGLVDRRTYKVVRGTADSRFGAALKPGTLLFVSVRLSCQGHGKSHGARKKAECSFSHLIGRPPSFLLSFSTGSQSKSRTVIVASSSGGSDSDDDVGGAAVSVAAAAAPCFRRCIVALSSGKYGITLSFLKEP
ncbi:hypothetical protein V1478_018047 [Vespula squamosa]|uniref:Uncharacterized protein n=1 Tax=Vespula squamosa TaxID=30214 RepID=A0ABD1ZVY4_VESSQ